MRGLNSVTLLPLDPIPPSRPESDRVWFLYVCQGDLETAELFGYIELDVALDVAAWVAEDPTANLVWVLWRWPEEPDNKLRLYKAFRDDT